MTDLENMLTSQIEDIMKNSGLSKIFEHSKTDIVSDGILHARWSAGRNPYHIRNFELWQRKEGATLRIFHAVEISEKIKVALQQIGATHTNRYAIDYRGDDLTKITISIYGVLNNPEIKKEASDAHVLARDSRVAGLDLPDVDTDILRDSTAFKGVFDFVSNPMARNIKDLTERLLP